MTDTRSLKLRTAYSAMWAAGGRWLVRLMGVLNVAVLARFLSPGDFGFVAIAMSVVAVLDLLLDYGNENFLVRNKEKNEDDYATVWTLNIIRGILMGGLIAVCAKPLSVALEDPRYFQIFIWLGAIVSFSGLKSIFVVDFQKDLRFDKDFLLSTSAQLIAITSSIAAAYYFRSYWALIIGFGSRQCATVIISYLMIWRLPNLSFKGFRRIFSFSIWLIMANSVFALASRIDAVLLQRFISTAAIGLYTVGTQVSGIAVGELISPLERALFPAISQAGSDKDEYRHLFCRGVSVLLLFVMPAGIGVATIAPQLTRVLLGEQWAAAAAIVAVMALSKSVGVTAPNLRIAIMISGNTELAFYRSLYVFALRVTGLISGAALGGFVAAAIGVALASLVITFIDLFLARHLIQIRFRLLMSQCWRAVISSFLMGVICLAASYRLGPASGFFQSLTQLIWIVLIGAISYSLVLLALWRLAGKPEGPEAFVISFLRETGYLKRILGPVPGNGSSS